MNQRMETPSSSTSPIVLIDSGEARIKAMRGTCDYFQFRRTGVGKESTDHGDSVPGVLRLYARVCKVDARFRAEHEMLRDPTLLAKAIAKRCCANAEEEDCKKRSADKVLRARLQELEVPELRLLWSFAAREGVPIREWQSALNEIASDQDELAE